MKYVTYNNDGKIIGFYSDDIAVDIPDSAMRISEEVWLDLVEYQGLRRINTDTGEIIKLELPKAVVQPDWNTLISSLRGTPLFYKLYLGAKNNLALNVAYTTLLNSFNMRNLNDLRFALTETKNLGNEPSFSLQQTDIDIVNELLTDNHFGFTV